MANLKSQLAMFAVLGVPILLAAVVFGPAAFDLVFHRRAPERYIIPAGYTGWVRIDYDQKSSPSLPLEDGRRLIKFDASGNASTSSSPLTGHGKDEFFYDSATARTPLSTAGVCKGGMVWEPETTIDPTTSTASLRFFVGTEDAYRHEVDPTGKKFPACE
jgi:hypothetical protein